MKSIKGNALACEKEIAIVVARFNQDITQELLSNAKQRFKHYNYNDELLTIVEVPGAVEIAYAALKLAQTKKYAAIICFAAVIKGETAHFEYVSESCFNACNQVMLAEKLPVIMGVLTTYTKQQAIERTNGVSTNMGEECVDIALEMINLSEQITS